MERAKEFSQLSNSLRLRLHEDLWNEEGSTTLQVAELEALEGPSATRSMGDSIWQQHACKGRVKGVDLPTSCKALPVVLGVTGLPIDCLVACFHVCTQWRAILKSTGFSHVVASLCVRLAQSKSCKEVAKSFSQRPPAPCCAQQSKALWEQILLFFHRHREVYCGYADGWADLALHEPEGSVLRDGMASMQWCWQPEHTCTKEALGCYQGSFHWADHAITIAMYGDVGVGKSNLLRQFLHEFGGEGFDEKHTPTEWMEYSCCTFVLDMGAECTNIKLQVKDTTGHHSRLLYKALNQGRNLSGVMVVYDVSDESSFLNVRWFAQHVNRISADFGPIPVLLVGNKCDMAYTRTTHVYTEDSHGQRAPCQVVTRARGQALADELGWMFVETSAKDETNVNLAFVCLARESVRRIMESKESSTPCDLAASCVFGSVLRHLWRLVGRTRTFRGIRQL